MCNVIIEDGAIESLCNYLKVNFENKNVALVSTKKDLNIHKYKLEMLKNLPLNLNVCLIQDDVVCNKLHTSIVYNKALQSDYIICFGVSGALDTVKFVASKLNIGYSIVPTKIKEGNYISKYTVYLNEDGVAEYVVASLPDCIYVDQSIVGSICRRDIASLFAFVLSLNLSVCKMLYEGFEGVDIESVQNLLKNINIFTSENIITKSGALKLFKLMFEIQLFLNTLNIQLNIEKIVSMHFKFYKDSNNLRLGEICLIFSILILTLHDKIINNKICLPPLNIGKRISRLKMLFNKDKYIEDVVTNLETETESTLIQLSNKKKLYSKNIYLALNRMCGNVAMLKRIYVDKGVMFSNVNINDFYNTLSVGCDIIKDKYLSVILSVGALDL